jgi:hypothetical protein
MQGKPQAEKVEVDESLRDDCGEQNRHQPPPIVSDITAR